MKRLLALACCIAQLAAAQGLFDLGGNSPLRLGVSPKNGSNCVGRVQVGGGISDGPDGQFTVIVKCFGVTHHHRTPQRVSLLGIKTDTGFTDDYFNVTPGQHTALVSVWQEGNPKPLAEAQTTFTVVKPDGLDERELDRLRAGLFGAAQSVADQQRWLWSHSRAVRSGKEPAARLADTEKALQSSREFELRTRVNALLRVAELNEQVLEPSRALRCLQLAQEIHDKESGAFTAIEPPYLDYFARYYARRGEYEKAVEARKQIIAWHESQPKQNRNALGYAYESLGNLYVLFKNDLDAYKACQEKAAKFR